MLPKSGIRTPEQSDTILKESQEFKIYDYISFDHFFSVRKDKIYSCVVSDEHLNEMLAIINKKLGTVTLKQMSMLPKVLQKNAYYRTGFL